MALTPVNITTYEAFKADVLGRGFNVDGVYGYQCVDMAKLLAGNAGRPSPYWKSGLSGYAREGWTDPDSRAYNQQEYFDLVYNKAYVKKGDLVVLDQTTSNPYGHIAFADSDWDANTTSAVLLGQNQVDPSATQGHVNTLTNVNVTTFLGAFRFKPWNNVPPTPTYKKKGNFPFYMYRKNLQLKRGVI